MPPTIRKQRIPHHSHRAFTPHPGGWGVLEKPHADESSATRLARVAPGITPVSSLLCNHCTAAARLLSALARPRHTEPYPRCVATTPEDAWKLTP